MQDSRAGFLDALTVDLKHGRLFPDLVAAAVATPGVRSAAISLRLPTEQAGLRVPLRIDGDETSARAIATLRPVTPRYFETAGIVITSGRGLTADDRQGVPLVTLVNAAFVREILRGRMAIGTRLRTEIVADPIAIVGVAAEVTRSGEADRPAMYVALDQIAVAGGSLLVRTLRAPEAVQPLLLSRVHEAAPGLAPDRVQQLSATIASTRAVARFNAQLAGGFAAIALLLAAIGVYGLTGEKSPAGGASWRCGWRSARRGAPPSGVPAHPLRWRLVSD